MSLIFAHQLCSGVYLCTPTVLSRKYLKLLNVESVVLCTTKSTPMLPGLRYFTVYVEDNHLEDIRCFFEPAVNFIEERSISYHLPQSHEHKQMVHKFFCVWGSIINVSFGGEKNDSLQR